MSKKDLDLKAKADIVSICIALIVLDAMSSPMLRALISEPHNAAYLVFRIATIALALFNAFIIVMVIRQIRQIRSPK